MPVEIRELIIRTEIRTEATKTSSFNENDLIFFKEEILASCKRILSEGIKKTSYRR